MKIAFTGGGTGGHIYPALAVAAALRGAEFDLFWIGRAEGMDRSIVEEAGLRFYGISTGKLRRHASLKNITDVCRIVRGLFQARCILAREKPALLFSKGGFVSVPPVVAAAFLGIPVHTHESDVSPGLATKINARFAVRIWTSCEKTALFLRPALRKRVRCSGNPVRSAFFHADRMRGRAFIEHTAGVRIGDGKKILLVLGGSQGADEVNRLASECRAALAPYFFIVHQTGAGAGFQADADYLPLAYIKDEMPDVLAAADLVLGRSGAGTVWEAAAAGIPMVLVPLAGSGTRGDQVENARHFEAEGAARVLVHPSSDGLLRTLLELASDDGQLARMAAAAKKAGRGDSAELIACEIRAQTGGAYAGNR